MSNAISLLHAALLLTAPAAGLPFEGDTEYRTHRFAQTWVGLEYEAVGPGRLYDPATGGSAPLGARGLGRVGIGALHFWGHADFYVSFPVLQHSLSGPPEVPHRFSTGILTGFRAYPWQLTTWGVRPYAGIAWAPSTLRQAVGDGEAGIAQVRHRFPLEGGLSLLLPVGLLEAGARYWPAADLPYAVSRTDEAMLRLPSVSAWLGWKFVFDTTIGAEEGERSGFNVRRLENLRKLGLAGRLGVGVGPSFVTTVSPSSWNTEQRPWLRRSRGALNLADFTLTAAVPELDGHLSLSYRNGTSEDVAFGFSQKRSRRSLALEVFRNLANFHGFVPYVGLFGSYEGLAVTETDGGATVLARETHRPGFGVLVGWDILPTQSEFLVLRTNLRYSPTLALPVNDRQSIAFDQFEFNVIQVVIFPGRLVNHLRTRNES